MIIIYLYHIITFSICFLFYGCIVYTLTPEALHAFQLHAPLQEEARDFAGRVTRLLHACIAICIIWLFLIGYFDWDSIDYAKPMLIAFYVVDLIYTGIHWIQCNQTRSDHLFLVQLQQQFGKQPLYTSVTQSKLNQPLQPIAFMPITKLAWHHGLVILALCCPEFSDIVLLLVLFGECYTLVHEPYSYLYAQQKQLQMMMPCGLSLIQQNPPNLVATLHVLSLLGYLTYFLRILSFGLTFFYSILPVVEWSNPLSFITFVGLLYLGKENFTTFCFIHQKVKMNELFQTKCIVSR